ncbi:MAG: ATP-binding protein [Myxococcales bacterium]|nr:ATP-binding protein [Myxococcales bacterium]
MAMKPWYKIVTPREDLRDGKPLDASEFAVHLDHVRDGRAPAVYQNPAEFFERTFLTKNLRDLTAQVVRRLSGVKVETSAIFNLSTQFGGGKTHSLTLLYHLAQNGDAAKPWKGVNGILQDAGMTSVPTAATAIFVGTEFDSITGRGGNDGTPVRKTPWGEIAFQLGGVDGFRLVEEHEKLLTAPGGDVIERMLPKGKPILILLDELMNYVSRSRKSGLAAQLYNFLHNLSEVARGRDNVVLAVSIPASELEMTAEDQSDFERYKKMLDRLGKAVIMSAETETSEIIRRRLFEWNGLPKDALGTIEEYEVWLQSNKQQLPSWFPVENAREALKASYPFHPSLLSVFERKWQGLPRFQQTRGVLRLLALWVSKAFSQDHQKAYKDPLISLGSAPIEDPLFRAALFEQLGEARLEPAVTTDIAGKDHSHALRLDAEATPEVKKARLHRKVATTILFESNGGQQRGEATLPEVRLAVAEPGLDIGSVEQCLEALSDSCYFLAAERNRYRFSFQPNLNKLLADRRASVSAPAIDEYVRKEIQKVFAAGSGVERVPFPRKSSEVPDRPVLALCILAPENAASDPATKNFITTMTIESGSSSRTFKSALIWVAAEDPTPLLEEARKLLAWKDIEGDAAELKLDETQQRQLTENAKRAERDLREAVWRAYKNVFLLADDNSLRKIDLGLVHSSMSTVGLVDVILSRLRQEDIVVDGVSPNFLTRYWPPALPEWSTKSVRDAFYASPKFPRLLKPDAVKDTISRGLDAGSVAYVGKAADGSYEPFIYKRSLAAADIEFADDVYLIARERADEYLAKKAVPTAPTGAPQPTLTSGGTTGGTVPAGAPTGTTTEPTGGTSEPPPPGLEIAGFRWTGEISPQKWMNFYTKVLSRFATAGGLKLTVTVDVTPPGGATISKMDETKVALRELGLPEDIVVQRRE